MTNIYAGVSIRISIMDLMLNLAKELDVSYLYITHDLPLQDICVTESQLCLRKNCRNS
ncbi:MAG: hypothetical protein Ct9H90mP17_1900 [Actinomycetota bacterium]|nr:MAG: hypothetical protein Ct9H90mP17_1900 [Actinomycetota bacterium]